MTNHYDDPDATPANQERFWDDDADWTPGALDRQIPRATIGAGAAASRWWDSLLGGSTPSGRSHGTPAAGQPRPTADTTSGHEAGGAWFVEPRKRNAGRGGIDPMVARLGGAVIAVTLAVPLILGFTSSSDDQSLRTATESSTPTAVTTQTIPLGSADAAGPVAAPDAQPSSTPAPVQAAATTAQLPAETTAAPATTAAPVTAPPTTASPCGSSYEVVVGDYWIRIADAAGVSLASLLDVNDASADSMLSPGGSICLPVGASTPAPPAPPTTSAPRVTTATTSPPRATNPPAPPTPRPPSTPTTTSPPRPSAVSAAEAEAIIRSVWPDDLEDRAVLIAQRESNLQSNVRNYCCYGLFQIYFDVHKSWLDDLGVTSAAQLYDPRTNAVAAYTLYQRSGGWGPWSQTAYG